MAAKGQLSYVIDTSALIHWYVETYPPILLPKLPDRIEGLIAEGRLVAPIEVESELERQADDLLEWAKGNPALFVEEDENVQAEVRELMRRHFNRAKPHKGISGADPFVIAMAKVRGKRWAVVANENPGSAENRKIPFVCKDSGIPCMDFQGMMRQERWVFR